MSSMRAVVCDRLGDPSDLTVQDIPLPEAGPRDVVVKVGAAGVNFPDILSVAGTYQHKPVLPFVPGMEGAGTVHAVGREVTAWKPGDRVIFGVRPGAFAEYVKVSKPNALVPLPDGWSEVEGAGYRVAAHTAYHSLVHRAAVKNGDVALVHGASGGVGPSISASNWSARCRARRSRRAGSASGQPVDSTKALLSTRSKATIAS